MNPSGFPRVGHCHYCGSRTKSGHIACYKHADLPALDPYYIERAKRRRFRSWWLDRYTPEEIVVLACGLEPTHAVSLRPLSVLPSDLGQGAPNGTLNTALPGRLVESRGVT